MAQAILGLERVRSEVDISTLPRPPILHRGIYVIDGGNGGDDGGEEEGEDSRGGDGFHICDPLPDAWVEIGRQAVTGKHINLV